MDVIKRMMIDQLHLLISPFPLNLSLEPCSHCVKEVERAGLVACHITCSSWNVVSWYESGIRMRFAQQCIISIVDRTRKIIRATQDILINSWISVLTSIYKYSS